MLRDRRYCYGIVNKFCINDAAPRTDRNGYLFRSRRPGRKHSRHTTSRIPFTKVTISICSRDKNHLNLSQYLLDFHPRYPLPLSGRILGIRSPSRHPDAPPLKAATPRSKRTVSSSPGIAPTLKAIRHSSARYREIVVTDQS